MLLSGESLSLDAFQRLDDRGGILQLEAQSEGVDKEADEAFDLTVTSIGSGRANDEIVLT